MRLARGYKGLAQLEGREEMVVAAAEQFQVTPESASKAALYTYSTAGQSRHNDGRQISGGVHS